MAGTSEYTARIRVEPVEVFNDNEAPVGSQATRLVANNLNHYSDIFGQVRMCWGARAGAGTAYWSTAATTEWALLGTTGAFPLAINSDGSSYRIRITLYAQGLTGFFAVVLAPLDRARGTLTAVLDAAGNPGGLQTDSVWITGAGGASPALISGASQGPEAYSDMVGLTAEEAGSFVVPVAGLDDIGGNEAAGPQCLVTVSVWGTGTAAVYGATLTEVP